MESSADSLNTINDLFYRIIDRDAVRVMLHRQDGAWRPISSAEIYTFTVGVARALQAWSIRPGDRIALLSENRPEWAIADFAIMLLGAVVVPIYPTLTEEQVAHILRDSGSRAIFVSTERHLRRLLPVLSQTPVEHVVVMDESTVTVETTLATSMPQLMLSGPRKRDADFDRRSRDRKSVV